MAQITHIITRSGARYRLKAGFLAASLLIFMLGACSGDLNTGAPNTSRTDAGDYSPDGGDSTSEDGYSDTDASRDVHEIDADDDAHLDDEDTQDPPDTAPDCDGEPCEEDVIDDPGDCHPDNCCITNNCCDPRICPEHEDPLQGGLAFAVISDLNDSYGSTTYGQRVHESVRWIIDDLQPDLVISTGDMVAGQKAGLDYRAMWTGFHAAVTEPFASADIPFAPTPGNHDASGYSSFAGERDIYVDEWSARRPAVDFVDDDFYPLRYAFKVKGVLFISLDDTTIGPLSQTQHDWVRSVLQANADAPVKVVFGHVPLYPVTKGRETEILDDSAFEDLLNEFDVDIMFAGHHHGYYPGRRGDLRLANLACLGSGPRPLVGTTDASPRTFIIGHIAPDGTMEFDAWDPLSRELLPRSSLPESLNSGAHKMIRDDL